MIKVFTPNDIQEEIAYLNREGRGALKIFLAGTIGGGKNSEITHEVNWQKDIISYIKYEYPNVNLIIFNPRRDNWPEKGGDKQNIDYQIQWELEHMEKADVIIMNILEDSLSPITLMEMGLWAGKNPNKLKVYCPNNFWRFDNVDNLCCRYNVVRYNSLYSMIDNTIKSIWES